jgi:hypothetical protein
MKKAGDLGPSGNGGQNPNANSNNNNRPSSSVSVTYVGYGGVYQPGVGFHIDGERRRAEGLRTVNLDKHMLKCSIVQSPGHADTTGRTCFGDSGGTGYLSAEDELQLVGLGSWGDATCSGQIKLQRLDTPIVQNFIHHEVEKHDQNAKK